MDCSWILLSRESRKHFPQKSHAKLRFTGFGDFFFNDFELMLLFPLLWLFSPGNSSASIAGAPFELSSNINLSSRQNYCIKNQYPFYTGNPAQTGRAQFAEFRFSLLHLWSADVWRANDLGQFFLSKILDHKVDICANFWIKIWIYH